MKRHFINNHIVYNIVISMMQSTILGVYLAIFSDKIIKGITFINAFFELKYYNIFLLVSIVLFILQICFGILERTQQSNNKEDIINSILKASCNTLVYPNSKLHIRAIITVCDYKNQVRTTRYSYNIESAPERTATYDLYFGVTGKAVKNKASLSDSVSYDSIITSSPQNAQYVDPDLKCVLAAPIYSLKSRDKVIAVLAFDSIEPLEKIKFNTRKSKEIAQMWADVLSHVIEEYI